MIAIAREPLAVIDPTMAEASHIQSVVRTPRVRVYNAVKPYFPPYHGHQRARAGIQHDPRIHLPAALQNTEHNHLAACPPTTLALARAAKITLVQLHLAAKLLAPMVLFERDALAQPAEESGRRIAMDSRQIRGRSRRGARNEVFHQL